MTDCVFCRPAAVTNDNITFDNTPKGVATSLIVTETSNFAVVLDIAPIVENHCLLIPKRHLSAFAYLTSRQWDEAEMLLGQMTKTLARMDGFQPSLFEHGTHALSNLPSCCVEHAHIHIVPTEEDLTCKIKEDGFSLIEVGGYNEVSPIIRQTPYLYYRASSQEGHFYNASNMPSQYLRRILADSLGLEIWNWRDYVDLSDFPAVLARLLQNHRTLVEQFEYQMDPIREKVPATPVCGAM
jgi:diadenosine tetraphosphate (Ap4A) HIT family hydrolase